MKKPTFGVGDDNACDENEPDSLPKRVSVSQLAKWWGCSPTHVYNLAASGKLQAVYVGSLIRFRREDIEAYERRGQERPTPALAAPPSPPPPAPASRVAALDHPVRRGFLAGQRIARQRRDAAKS